MESHAGHYSSRHNHATENRSLSHDAQLTKKRCENVVTTFKFGCENVLVKRLYELFWKVFSMFAKRFGTTLQKNVVKTL